MKKFYQWAKVLTISVILFAAVIVSTFFIHGDVKADEALTTEDIAVIKQNVLYKSVYSNLWTCYGEMRGTIAETESNVWAKYDSQTYFSEKALGDDFLKFPFGVGDQNASSCPKMITGWKTNWFINLFTRDGSYDGLLSLKTDAEVPDGSYESSPEKMSTFLKNIGYEQKSDMSIMADRKCFYLTLETSGNGGTAGYVPAKTKFETVDYCVKVDNNGLVVQDGKDGIIILFGNNSLTMEEYDNGHLTDASNAALVYFQTDDGLAPQFRVLKDVKDEWDGKNYLQANTVSSDGVTLLYWVHDAALDTKVSQVVRLPVVSVSSKDDIDVDDGKHCTELGYQMCAYYFTGTAFKTTHYIASLTQFGEQITFDQFKERMKKLYSRMQFQDSNGAVNIFNNVQTVDYIPSAKSYVKTMDGKKYANYFLGDTSKYNQGVFLQAEKYMLYYTYLKEHYGVATADTQVKDNAVQVDWLDEATGDFTKLYIYDPDEDLNDVQYILDAGNRWSTQPAITANWHEIAEALATINAKSAFDGAVVKDPVLDPDVDPNTPENQEGDGVTPNCYRSAGSLGWILCVSLESLANVTEGMYEYIKDEFLVINDSLYASDSPMHDTWKDIRNWGNLIFVILLLIVIFSQVTGIGLDNYGVKKTLPRLIAIVVIVNLSFIICQVAIDLSNIVGEGIYKLLTVDIEIKDVSYAFEMSDFVDKIKSTLFDVTAIGVTGLIAVKTWSAWLIPLLLFFLASVISGLFFGVLLAVRKAAVIILAIFSPIAIVCYALPNTKKIFDRWYKLFSAMLLLYPISAALMGGGILSSKILLSAAETTSTSFFFQLVAMLTQIVPIFFIPSLTRSAFTAMGNLGTKIAGWGDRIGRSTTGAIRNADATRDLQKRMTAANAQHKVRRMQENKDALGRLGRAMNRIRAGSGDALLNSNTRARAKARNAAIANRDYMETQQSIANQDLYADDENRAAAVQAQYEREQREKDIKAYMERDAAAGISTDEDELARIYKEARDRLLVNANDTDANARLVAAQRRLATTDSGRTLMQNALYESAHNLARSGLGNSAGFARVADSLFSESGGEIKSRNRGFFNFLKDAKAGKDLRVTGGNFTQVGDEWQSSGYDTNGAGDYSPETMINADDTALKRINSRFFAPDELNGADQARFRATARSIFSNQNIASSLKPKVAEEIHKIANSEYTQDLSTRNATRYEDVDVRDAQRLASADNAELSRIIQGMRSGTINGAEMKRMGYVAQRAIERANAAAANPNGGNGPTFTVGAGNDPLLRQIIMSADLQVPPMPGQNNP